MTIKNEAQQDIVRTENTEPTAPVPVLFGNENFVSDRRTGRSETPPTGAEWLVEAKEIETVIARGDAVSIRTLERLFLDAVPVIEGAMGGSGEPLTAKQKKEAAERAKREADNDERHDDTRRDDR